MKTEAEIQEMIEKRIEKESEGIVLITNQGGGESVRPVSALQLQAYKSGLGAGVTLGREIEREQVQGLAKEVDAVLNFIDKIGMTSGPLVQVMNTLSSALTKHQAARGDE